MARRGRRAGHARIRAPQEPGRSLCLLSKERVSVRPTQKNQAPEPPRVRGIRGAKAKHVGEVPVAEETPKAAGMGREKSERPDSTCDAGERVPPDPAEGGGASSHGSS